MLSVHPAYLLMPGIRDRDLGSVVPRETPVLLAIKEHEVGT